VNMETDHHANMRKIAFIGNYLPRKCGIATFTTDIVGALTREYEGLETVVLAMNDTKEGYDYPDRVRFQLDQHDLVSYQAAADFINLNDVDLVCLQHEYGIFGGDAGDNVLTLLRQLEVPVVTTLHTILKEPTPVQLQVMKELVQLSDRLIVMSERGVDYLKQVYDVPVEKIDLIPHGIPDVPFVDPNFFKDKFNVEGRPILLTFGLLSPNKGIENVIQALPMVNEQFPDVVYICAGSTHPHVILEEGENYRESLQQMAKDLGVEENIQFIDRFVSSTELNELIGAADIYITPYLNRDQITSGTLAYTVGAGKPVISTPYWYAEELLADDRGILVPFRDPEAIAKEVVNLLENDSERHALRKRAYMYGRTMIWPEVARRYMRSFERVREERSIHPHFVRLSKTPNVFVDGLPQIKLDHLLRMTDNTGMFQHANFHLPNYQEGYCTDDNARALIVTMLIEQLGGDLFNNAEALASRYLSFLWYALNETGRFRNFLSFDRRWLEEQGSEDSHGRALLGLGTVIGRSDDDGLRSLAGKLFDRSLADIYDYQYLRSSSYTLIGIHEYLRRFPGDRAVMRAGESLSDRLLDYFTQNADNEWVWFEDELTYSNASLPHALLLTSQWRKREDMRAVGLRTLRWLVDLQTTDQGIFSFIGNDGFYVRRGTRAYFDQQPIEAGTTVSACLEAFRMTGDRQWYLDARRAFEWFLGKNAIGLPLYNDETGGCRDGLSPDRVNANQGAESLLAYLQSLLELQLMERSVTHEVKRPERVAVMKQRSY
jgi:glycosyltransferase involved in cell wall biosynthesis